ncbi:MAG: ATP-binding cassette domain-containing protein [Mariprofundaceae bacterium]
MIKLDKLSRNYGDRPAVFELSFHVHRGEVMGLLGPNGAGKSTTMKMLTCYLPPSAGYATIADVPLDGDSIAIRRNLGYLPENAPSYQELNVRSHLQFIGHMHQLPAATLTDRINEMSRACGLEQVMHRRIDELSKGYRQRVGLAASMLHDPVCLILDEPTTGLDPNQIIEIRHLIRRLGEKKTVLLSSHVLPEVEAACDRMMIIDDGKLQAIGTSAELRQQAAGGSLLYATFAKGDQRVIDLMRQQLPALNISRESKGDEVICTFSHEDSEMPLAELVFRAAVQSEAIIVEMRRDHATLEDIFRRLTGGAS